MLSCITSAQHSRCGLSQVGVFVEPIRCEAVEGAGLHRDAFDVTVGPLRQVERLEHPEACNVNASRENLTQCWVSEEFPKNLTSLFVLTR